MREVMNISSFLNPLSAERGERVVERSNDQVSLITEMHSSLNTHPDYAALVDPLFTCGEKRVEEICLFFSNPLCGEAEERVVERSNDRVSLIAEMHSSLNTHLDYAALVDPLFTCGGKRVGKDLCIPFKPSLRRSRREGGRAKQRPGESNRRQTKSCVS